MVWMLGARTNWLCRTTQKGFARLIYRSSWCKLQSGKGHYSGRWCCTLRSMESVNTTRSSATAPTQCLSQETFVPPALTTRVSLPSQTDLSKPRTNSVLFTHLPDSEVEVVEKRLNLFGYLLTYWLTYLDLSLWKSRHRQRLNETDIRLRQKAQLW